MTQIVSVEFLEANGFQLKQYADGMYWVRTYMYGYSLQVNQDLDFFTEDDHGHVFDMSEVDFVKIVNRHQLAITQ